MYTDRDTTIMMELLLGGSAFLLVLCGVLLSYIDPVWFKEVYVREDGIIETLTVLVLLGISLLMFGRLFRLRNEKGKGFLLVLFLLGAFGLFGAGEEVSWGQRLWEIESTDFFLQHNAQGETNLHNLVVKGEKLNKIIFSQLLFIGITIYLLVLPLVYRRVEGFEKVIDDVLGIPIARKYQVGAFGAMLLLTNMVTVGKGSELLEFGSCMVFLLIFLYPANKKVYAFTAKTKVADKPEKKEVFIAQSYAVKSIR
ncbi:hypothetical protein [Cesiribacter sp. SM1]|uniref:hypothetical protein n=1 Tax=Cesiribacter sp. SM1 TaxID=2861196 RepID=UPI001CD29509|nr:hypothetical protein [Cesiribacter sp. SM1]